MVIFLHLGEFTYEPPRYGEDNVSCIYFLNGKLKAISEQAEQLVATIESEDVFSQ